MGAASAQPGSSAPQASSATPDLTAIVANLEHAQQQNRSNIKAYVVTRDYQLFAGAEQQPKSTVIAEVTFEPPTTKTYEIRESNGSSQGEKVVRKILDHEQQMSKDVGDHDLSRQNYEFAYLGERSLNGRRCYLLKIVPKRDQKDLLDGIAWIDADSFMPRRVEGSPSKSPSWWVKKLQIQMTYAPVEGMWLPTSSRAEADVRLFGKHTFVGRDIAYQRLDAVAKRSRPHRRSTAAEAGMGIIVAR